MEILYLAHIKQKIVMYFFSVLLYQLPLWMLTSLPIVSHSGGSVTGLVVGIISVALLIAVAVITLGILCK